MSSLTNPLSYIRISTTNQSTGTSIESQLQVINEYVQRSGSEIPHGDQYIETASGRRPNQLTRDGELREVIQRAKSEGRPIVVTRIDRLTRDVEVAQEIFDAGITIHEAQNNDVISNARAISYLNRTDLERQKKQNSQQSAYQAKRERGEEMGNPDIQNVQKKGVDAVKRKADEFARKVYPEIEKHLQAGLNSNKIAKMLNEEGIPTQKGAEWSRNSVEGVIKRYNSQVLTEVRKGFVAAPSNIDDSDLVGQFA